MKTFSMDNHGNGWLLDKERMKGVIRQYAYVNAALTNTRIIRTKDHWLQKVGIADAHAEISMADSLIEAKKKQITSRKMKELEALYSGDWFDVYNYLIDTRIKMLRMQHGLNSLFASAQEINTANIESARRMITITRGVRDTSVISLSVIAAVGTGGLTVALATGASAAGSSIATYQDTGSMSKALTSGGLALVPLGSKKLEGAMKVAKHSRTVIVGTSALIDFTADTASEIIISDAKIDQALRKALFKFTLSTGGDYIKPTLVSEIGKRLRGAVKITESRIDSTNRLPALLAETGIKAVQEVVTSRGEKRETGSVKIPSKTPEDPIERKAYFYINDVVMKPTNLVMPGNGKVYA